MPFLTVLSLAERSPPERGQRPMQWTDGARNMLLLVGRWVPERPLVPVTERSFAVVTLW